MAIADHDTLFFNRRAPAERKTFDISNVRELPRVDIIYSYGGADSVLVDAAVAAGAKGIVVAGVGEGKLPPGQEASIKRAAQKGVVIVVGSRTGSGRVSGSGPNTGTLFSVAGVIPAGDLNVQHARILLMLALAKSSDPATVTKIFGDYTAGEKKSAALPVCARPYTLDPRPCFITA